MSLEHIPELWRSSITRAEALSWTLMWSVFRAWYMHVDEMKTGWPVRLWHPHSPEKDGKILFIWAPTSITFLELSNIYIYIYIYTHIYIYLHAHALRVLPFGTYFWLFTICASCFGYPQCFGAILLLSVTYALCKALLWRLLWIKASAKWIHVNVNIYYYHYIIYIHTYI